MELASEANNNVPVGGHKNQSNGSQSSQQKEEQEIIREEARHDHGEQSTAIPVNDAYHPTDKYQVQIKELRAAGQRLRSDSMQPDLMQKPTWFEEDLFENAKSVYARHFMGVNFAHLSGLLLLVRVNSIYRTLSVTGNSDSVAKLFNRYYQTVVYVKKWYEGDIFDASSDAHRTLLIVRAMHNKVSATLNVGGNQAATPNLSTSKPSPSPTKNADDESSKLMSKHETDKQVDNELEQDAKGGDGDEKVGVHISEYDLLLTQFAFLGFIVTRAKYVGLIDDFSQYDLESLLHFWRVIGYYLGASDRYNLCSRNLDEVVGICNAIMEVEFKRSILKNPITSLPGIMGVNIVRSIKFIPMLTIYGITKYLYELIEIDTSEFEARATRYSRLSYTLIKLVMSRLLAYRGFRWFNNSLTRLSVFLVGKLDEVFANHLESKYGKELKL